MNKSPEQSLLNDLAILIDNSRSLVVTQANATLTRLFWQVGDRINRAVLNNQRAEYAKKIVSTLSTQLQDRYGKNFETRNLRRMMQ